jgi:hypothetical protein
MKFKYVINIIFFCFNSLSAQVTVINLTIYQDDVKLKDSITVNALIDDKWINLTVKDSFLFIPSYLFGKKVNLQVTTSMNKLDFNNLIIGWNDKYLHWDIYLDFPPFNRNWVVKGKLKRMKWVYAIERGNGTVITYYGRKKNHSLSHKFARR